MSHRAGGLKQLNKKHKNGQHRSKGELARADGGRVESASVRHKKKQQETKTQRINQAKQVRNGKRHDAIARKQLSGMAPHSIVVIGLSGDPTDPTAVCQMLSPEDTEVTQLAPTAPPRFTFLNKQLKRRVTLLPAATDDIFEVLALARSADTVLFALSATHPITEFGDLCTTTIKSLGCSSVAHLLLNLDVVPPKRRGEAKKAALKVVANDFPEARMHVAEPDKDPSLVVWNVANQKSKDIKWRENRPYLTATTVDYAASPADPADPANGTGTLSVTGYLRGHAINVNDLVYLPGHGACQLAAITRAHEPKAPAAGGGGGGDVQMGTAATPERDVLATPSVERLQSLQMDVPLDPMAGEQTWPTEEEIAAARGSDGDAMEQEAAPDAASNMVRVPEGTSSYQARWIAEAFGENGDPDDGSDMEDPEDAELGDMPGMGQDQLEVDRDGLGPVRAPSVSGSAFSDASSVSVAMDPTEKRVRYDEQMDLEEESRARAELMQAREDQEFPDEVDTPMNRAAKDRFQKYRGLASFRTSQWDPREELPEDYARIFQFQHFKQTRKRVLSKMPTPENAGDWVMPGTMVTLHIVNVPASYPAVLAAQGPVTIFGLLEHENKMSLLNFKLTMHSSYTLPIKSKERMIFYCGVRRFSACPIFSQHTIGNKHKFERFFQPGSDCVASVFAPVMFPPGPVLAFRQSETGGLQLVGTGSLMSVDPDRITVKRIRLAGHPYKINKKSATIRYMFHTPEDIDWFKPVELITKFGRRGHIRDSLGTHGHMKCVFDAGLNAQDTIIMNLYKRVYPKWNYAEM